MNRKKDNNNENLLKCLRCGRENSAAERVCSECGAELHGNCSQCGVARSADDEFCRQCGFNFRRRKLQLKQEPQENSKAEKDLPLPLARVPHSQGRRPYRMDSSMARLRALLMFVFLALVATGIYLAFNPEHRRLVFDHFKQKYDETVPNLMPASSDQGEDAPPDWKARAIYWKNYYLDAFVLPAANGMVTLTLRNGTKVQGNFLAVVEESVFIQQDGEKRAYARSGLDEATQLKFFAEQYARSAALIKVKAEHAEWKQKQQTAAMQSKASGVVSNEETAAAPLQFLEIKCPLCAGMGFLLVQPNQLQSSASSGFIAKQPDLAGSKKSKSGLFTPSSPANVQSQPQKRTCPICQGLGLRRFDRTSGFPWPNGASRCTTCQGMGRVALEAGPTPQQAITCKTCDGRGYVINHYNATQNVPPNYE